MVGGTVKRMEPTDHRPVFTDAQIEQILDRIHEIVERSTGEIVREIARNGEITDRAMARMTERLEDFNRRVTGGY